MVELTFSKIKTYCRLGQRGAIMGMAINDSAQLNPKLMVLTADLALLSGLDRFIRMYPEQFINVGIAEQNMIGIAAGFAAEGLLPVATTYATFVTMRSCEQIRHFMGYMNLKIIVVGSGAGLVQGYSGNTHYTIEDISMMRAIPNMTILSPADAGEAVKAFEAAQMCEGPVYIRLTGGLNCPIVYQKDYNFQIGKATILREGRNITIFAAGTMVSTALKTSEILENNNITVRVVNMYSLKPVDIDVITNSCGSQLLVSIEEHNVMGGLGGIISEVLSEISNSPVLLRLGIKDKFNLASDYEDLLSQNRLLPDQVAEDIVIKYNSLSL
ncbi:MAG: transketolase C-terminal domain-containing protein [Odoribacter sp.]